MQSVGSGHDVYCTEQGVDNILGSAGIRFIFTRSWVGAQLTKLAKMIFDTVCYHA